MKKNLLLILAIFIFALSGFAQTRKGMETANMSRALEAYQNGNGAEMYKYLNLEIQKNPKNGYAYGFLAYLSYSYQEGGHAIDYANKSLQFVPKKDKEFVAFVYGIRGDSYKDLLNDNDKALTDYNKMVSLTPKDDNGYEKRAQLYFETEKYDLSNKDYKKITSLIPTSPLGYLGLGRNSIRQKDYATALEMFNHVILMYSDNAKAYAFRAEVYLLTGEFEKSAGDIVKALGLDITEGKAASLLPAIADSSFTAINISLSAEAAKEPNESKWPYCLGEICEHTKQYKKAIEYYQKAFDVDANDVFMSRISSCYKSIYDYDEALKAINRAIEMDTSYIEYYLEKSNIYYDAGLLDEAVSVTDEAIAKRPASSYLFYWRGNMKYASGKTEEAIEDLSTAIILGMESGSVYYKRGQAYAKKGDNAMAKKNFQKVLEIDTGVTLYSYTQFAYLSLGEKDKAIQANNAIREKFPDNASALYNTACLYSLMGDLESAMGFLKKSLELDNFSINHIMMDEDLVALRETSEFQEFIEEQKNKISLSIGSKETIQEDTTGREAKVEEVPFKKRSGVTEINCSINGLPLYFIFDTGASDVTISSVEASFMLKHGYLSEKDILGRRNYYTTANGDIVEGTVINIGKITIGNLELTNVRASVVKAQNAPLLLGQSVLSRLGKIEIDNQKQVLRIVEF